MCYQYYALCCLLDCLEVRCICQCVIYETTIFASEKLRRRKIMFFYKWKGGDKRHESQFSPSHFAVFFQKPTANIFEKEIK